MSHLRLTIILLLLSAAILFPAHCLPVSISASNIADPEFTSDSIGKSSDRRKMSENAANIPVCRIRPLQIILPTAFIATGAVISASGWLRPGQVSDPAPRTSQWVDTTLEYAPVAAGMIMGFWGVHSNYTIRERMASRLTSALMLQALVQPTKHLVHSTRPNREDRHSFPSGHTAVSFMGAELLRLHYGLPWALGGYAVATARGVLRCVNHYHWPADVIAGAGFGILSANIAMWLLPWECKLMPFLTKGRKSLVDIDTATDTEATDAKNRKSSDSESASAILLPTYSADTGAVGLSFALTF